MEGLRTIAQLRQLKRSDVAAAKFDRDLWSASLTPILNLWKKLNQVRLDNN